MSGAPYRVIVADPPWAYRDRGQSGSKRPSGSLAHYPTMSIQQLCALRVDEIAHENSLCFMWTTGPQMEDSFKVMRAWGFEPKTVAFTWVKTTSTANSQKCLKKALSGEGVHVRDSREFVKRVADLLMPTFCFGQGSYTRANPEFVLLGRRGKGVARVSASVRALLLAGRAHHSAKPRAIQARIEALVGNEPSRIELFARKRRKGWDAWGNEVDCDVEIRSEEVSP